MPVTETSISKFDPNMAFSKLLLDQETYQKFGKKNIKGETLIEKFSYYFFKYYCCLNDTMEDDRYNL